MAYLAFYKGKGDFLNKEVRLFTRSKYSHCAIVAHCIEYSSTSRMGGVYAQRRYIPYDVKEWKLVKSAHDSSVEIPDPQYVQITDYWNHEFPGSEGKVYIYVVEGIKRPRIDTERSVNVLYQWFSTANNPSFTPQSITPAEWYNANVYTSPITDARVSKLRALCNIAEDKQAILQNAQDKDISLSLIGRGAKDNGNRGTGTATRPNVKSN